MTFISVTNPGMIPAYQLPVADLKVKDHYRYLCDETFVANRDDLDSYFLFLSIIYFIYY